MRQSRDIFSRWGICAVGAQPDKRRGHVAARHMFGPFRRAPKVPSGRSCVRGFLTYGDVAHFRTDHFSESRQSFRAMCGPKSISLAPELRAADAH
jgi:hypothetical protein